MKKILGLDLGTTSIGWAFVNEAEKDNERSNIKRIGVRVIPLTTDEEMNFQKGKSISTNADRTLKRTARRNLQRYKLRREALIMILKKNGIIKKDSILAETGNFTTFQTIEKRALAVTEQVELDEFARILLMINKKRGYKSSRKANNSEEGSLIDGMEVAKKLYDENLTPGQFVYNNLLNGGKYIPDFYRSDLQSEFEQIWEYQKSHHPEILTLGLKKDIEGKGLRATSDVFKRQHKVDTAELKEFKDKKLQKYKWRSEAVSKKLTIEEVAHVLCEVNNNLNNSSGYLGAISDRSKELIFKSQTVGQYQYEQLKSNPNTSLRNQVFYRMDYLHEFEAIWEKQAQYHAQLTSELKAEIRDVIIFYQRKLKSQKHLVSECEFEKFHKVIPKSSPLFQVFKVWSILNNLEIRDCDSLEKRRLTMDEKNELYKWLELTDKLKAKDAIKLLGLKPSDFELNYDEIEGNRTSAVLFNAYVKILEIEGYNVVGDPQKSEEIWQMIKEIFQDLGISTDILELDFSLQGKEFYQQPYYELWHLLYSFEGDDSRTGNDKLIEKLISKYGFKREHAGFLANTRLQADYGSLSARAIRKILPHLMEGIPYAGVASDPFAESACSLAGYSHSSSLTAEQLATRKLKDRLELLPKNSLRNPVVEKILNQLVNLINAVIDDPELGKPDEIRIELARELKKSAKERDRDTTRINESKADHARIKAMLEKDFEIKKVTRNDIIRYKLYRELEMVGYRDLYSGVYIPKEKIFSKEFDIEHIIPQASLFDDSFSNKTLSTREDNLKKGNRTAYDFVQETKSKVDFDSFIYRVETLFKNKKISKAKYEKLLTKGSEIPDGFIERDLRDSQYIARKAKQMLEEVFRTVTTTTGSVTDRLRQDWQLVNVMKELNLPKYRKLGLTRVIEGKNGQPEELINDWTKRNDHRHHAMDALTVAFTKRSHVQYLNNLSARSDKSSSIYGIEQKELKRDDNNKLVFKSPIPVNEFRAEAKKHLESVLISQKAKNKVVTKNINKIKIKGHPQFKTQIALTPRGQLHNETVYGCIRRYQTKEEKVGTGFDLETIKKVANKEYRTALFNRLIENNNDSKKAFGGKNSPSKNPVYTDTERTQVVPEKVKLVWLENQYTIRKEITPDLRIDKVIDVKVRQILEKRLKDYGGDAKQAFSNLKKNPIWLNEKKGIAINRVTITGVSNVVALHDKKDHLGNFILDENGKKQGVDFVSTGNNHHVAIYRDEKGNLQEEVVSLYEAVERVNQELPIIKKEHEKGWQFLFTMKQNEYFVFPGEDFNPKEMDLLDPENYFLISKYLFRVQTISVVKYGNSTIRDFKFKHHLETIATENKELKGISYHQIKSLEPLEHIVKVRLNHLGKIVHTGE